MTNQEAIRRIKMNCAQQCYRNYEGMDDHGRVKCRIKECKYRVAMEAIEKQIEKKPDTSFDGYADGYPIWEYFCPNCEKEIEWDEYDYCPECGQHIDWSEENDE